MAPARVPGLQSGAGSMRPPLNHGPCYPQSLNAPLMRCRGSAAFQPSLTTKIHPELTGAGLGIGRPLLREPTALDGKPRSIAHRALPVDAFRLGPHRPDRR